MRKRRSQAQTFGGRRQSFVTRPDRSLMSQRGGREQMSIDTSDAFSEEPVTLDEDEHFVILGDGCFRQLTHQIDDVRAVRVAARQTAAGDLTNHERMRRHPTLLKQLN